MADLIALDARLAAIAAMVPECECVADVGADHGYLGAYLLESRRCQWVQLLDISEKSLVKARRLIAQKGMQARTLFGVGDGAAAMQRAADWIVIAGMGGTTISQIVEDGMDRFGNAALILQANTAVSEMRRRVTRAGYRIAEEKIVRAAGRLYVIVKALPGSEDYSERELEIGPVLLRERPENLDEYARFRVRVAQKALRGALHGGNEQAKEMLKRELEIWSALGK